MDAGGQEIRGHQGREAHDRHLLVHRNTLAEEQAGDPGRQGGTAQMPDEREGSASMEKTRWTEVGSVERIESKEQLQRDMATFLLPREVFLRYAEGAEARRRKEAGEGQGKKDPREGTSHESCSSLEQGGVEERDMAAGGERMSARGFRRLLRACAIVPEQVTCL